MAKGCPECEALEKELLRLQALRVTEVKESDVFKVMYAKFSKIIPDVQKVSWEGGARAMQSEIAAAVEDLYDPDIGDFIRDIPLIEEQDADLQLQMRSRMRRKKGLDA